MIRQEGYKLVRYQDQFRLLDNNHLKTIKENGVLGAILDYLPQDKRRYILEGLLDVEVRFSNDLHDFEVVVITNAKGYDRGYTVEELNELAQSVAMALLKYEEDLHKQYQK